MSKQNLNLDHSQERINKPLQSDIKLITQNNDTKKSHENQQVDLSSGNQQEKSCFPPLQFMKDFFAIYKFGDGKDTFLMIIGIILAMISGVTFPLFMYFWGKEVDHVINDYPILSDTLDTSRKYFLAFIGLGICSFFINGIVFALWKLLSETLAKKIRIKYLQNFIKRKTKWHEQQNLYEISTNFKVNCMTIQKATGDKVALFYNLNGITTAGSIAALCIRWTYSLYLFALVPIGMLALGYFIYILIMRKIEAKQCYVKAQAQSSEAISLIKTVKAFGAQEFQQQLYNKCLDEYEQGIKSYPIKVGISTALFFFIQYFIFGIGFLFGIQCIRGTSACPVSVTGSTYSIGDLHIVFFQIYLCTYYFLQLASNFDAIRNAIKSSKQIDKFIKQSQQQSKKNSNIQSSQIPYLINEVEFKNVSFSYPSNANKSILKNISFTLLKNRFNALVGVTGSGKTTITQLLLKMYNPSKGQILIGNKNIAQYSSQQLRERIGIVSQEPVLFSGTIRQNVKVGKENATDDQVWEALREVNIEDFVKKLPNSLEYDIGFGGVRLSGGQKQRIAIARALIKKPQLLILDEATSALDRKSQKIIQKTLESLFLQSNLNMTVLCIAHKIKTIRKADKIMFLQSGSIKQQGRFQELNCFKDINISQQEQDGVQYNFQQQFQPIQKSHQQNQNQVQPHKQYQQNIYLKLLEYTQHKCLYVIGLIMAFLNGLNHPIAMLILSYAYTEQVKIILYKLDNGKDDSILDGYHIDATKYLGGLIGFAFYVFMPYLIQFYIMTKIEDQITYKIRKEVFHKLMIMPTKWYDKPQNEGGQVATRYGLDAKEISSLVSNFIPILVTNFTTIILGVILCLVYLWKVGLLSFFSIPLIAIGGYISMFFIGGYQDETLHRNDESNKIASQLMINIKTTLSLNYQQRLLQKYKSMLQQDTTQILVRGAKIGFFFGFSLFLIQASIGTTFYIVDHILSYIKVIDTIKVMVSLVVPTWCGWVAGNNFFFAAHAAAGKKSAQNVFSFLEEKTQKEVQELNSSKIIKPEANQIKGRIQFKNVSFKYNQHSKYVFKNISFVIEDGKKAAFVGESGCGKSTLMLLIQRFYEYEGQITLDGVNILDYDLRKYRSYFGVLNQQPSLFTGKVQHNIIFNNSVARQEVYDACQMSFAYDVNRAWKGQIPIKENIEEFLQREVGPKGSKLSGGEKQRVACARTILKNPRIFLMDEGTSALDRQTEKRVQKNIDSKLKGVTTVSITHRMETIENADIIFMLEDGKIIEKGTYEEMIERKAHFQKFVNGNKYKTINQVAEQILNKLVMRLLGIKKKQ